jgi:hypothetical protein
LIGGAGDGVHVNRQIASSDLVEEDGVAHDVDIAVEAKSAYGKIEALFESLARIHAVDPATRGRKVDPNPAHGLVVGRDDGLKATARVLEHDLEAVVSLLRELVVRASIVLELHPGRHGALS